MFIFFIASKEKNVKFFIDNEKKTKIKVFFLEKYFNFIYIEIMLSISFKLLQMRILNLFLLNFYF